jgi:D-alanyl-D-alanine carboxypeptidase/D-alanyl-D-alanine-endopeptidase (penicillin-binding protein 4)
MKKSLLLLPIIFFSFIVTNTDFVSEWKNDVALKPANFGFAFYDLDSGNYIIEHNKEKVLCAASTQKLFSTAIALKTMGTNHQFASMISYTGRIQEKTLRGDICIFPNKNPCLGSKRFGKSVDDIVDQIDVFLKSKGVEFFSNVQVVDPTYEKETLPRTWVWEDIGNYYGANPTGTILNENIIELYFKSGGVGTPVTLVKTVPEMPWLKFNNRVISSIIKKDLAYVFSEPNSSHLTIEGTIPANRNNFKVKASLPNPQKTLAYLVYEKLKAKGYTLKGKYKVRNVTKKTTQIITTAKSAPLINIINQTNKKSVNILAENLLENSYDYSGDKTGKLKWTKNYLKNTLKINTEGMVLKDGSGLSRFNAISPEQLVQVLTKMKTSKPFYESLPIAGESGTLKSFLINSWAKGNLHAKSGSMSGVRSYAGYLKTKSGKNIAFAIIVNNANCSAGKTKRKIEALLDHVSNL